MMTKKQRTIVLVIFNIELRKRIDWYRYDDKHLTSSNFKQGIEEEIAAIIEAARMLGYHVKNKPFKSK
jgi:hypothetical protein